MLEISLPNLVQETIEEFISSFLNGRKGIVGMSGGIDSTLVTYLASRAAPGRIIGVHLPEMESSPEDENDAREVAIRLGIDFRVINIERYISPFRQVYTDKKVLGNIKARIRMVVLYSLANKENALVIGSSNKSELLTGYFTKYGDGASDLMPIGDLYKTQVRLLSGKVGIPEKIIKKVPTAGLWSGQRDEDELGIDYDTLDKILYGIELLMDDITISRELGIGIESVKMVRGMVERSRHKRVAFYIPKVGIRTVGTDFRE
ncbi:MAG: NAD+ synthase [Thermoplasmata archaeon]|jgi:NAD+ synthase|nr:NAD+ synthase [Thermoplasmatales archaeon]